MGGRSAVAWGFLPDEFIKTKTEGGGGARTAGSQPAGACAAQPDSHIQLSLM